METGCIGTTGASSTEDIHDAPTERYSTHCIEERPSIPFFTFFTTSTINETIDDNHRTLEQFLLFFRNNVKGTLNKGDIP